MDICLFRRTFDFLLSVFLMRKLFCQQVHFIYSGSLKLRSMKRSILFSLETASIEMIRPTLEKGLFQSSF